MNEIRIHLTDNCYERLKKLEKRYGKNRDQVISRLINTQFSKSRKFEYKGKVYECKLDFYKKHAFPDCRSYIEWSNKVYAGEDALEALNANKRSIEWNGKRYKSIMALYRGLKEEYPLKTYSMFLTVLKVNKYNVDDTIDYFLNPPKRGVKPTRKSICGSCGIKTEFWIYQEEEGANKHYLCADCYYNAEVVFKDYPAFSGDTKNDFLASRISDIRHGHLDNFQELLKKKVGV